MFRWAHALVRRAVVHLVSLFLYYPPPFYRGTGLSEDRFVEVVPRGARKAVVYFHGNAGAASEASWLSRVCTEKNIAFFSAEYPGFGNTEPLPTTEEELFQAAERAFQKVVEKGYSPTNIYIWGRSLGSAPAVYLASQKTIGGLVVHSGFASVFTVVNRHLGRLARWTGFDVFDNATRLKSVFRPVAFVHSRGDELILFEGNLSENRLALPEHTTQTIFIVSGDHNEVPTKEEVDNILSWVLNQI